MKKVLSLFVALTFTASAFAAGHTVGITTTSATCFGMCDGTATANVSGGTGPFTYSWSPAGGTSATATGLCAGTYTVTVTDNSDFSTATATTNLTSPALLSVGSSGGTACAGACTAVPLTATGGTPPYNYLWSHGSTVPYPTVCPATTTTYTVTVTDINGCVATATSLVTVMSPPTLTVPSAYSVCTGACVSLTATATGGSTYNWFPATGLSTTTAPNPVSCPVSTTTYTITASFAGCTSTALTVVSVISPVVTGISSTNTTGCVTCDGTASTAPTGGSGPYIYNWSNGATTSAISSLCAGSYSVTVTDMSGCTALDSTTVFANNSALGNFTMVPDSTNPFNFFAFNTSIGSGNYYLWEFGDGTNDNVPNPTHTFVSPGVYNICLSTINFLCGSDTICQPLTVTGVSTPCNALFNIADDTLNPDPNAHYVYNLSYGATLTYLWDFGDGNTSTSATPSHVYTGAGPYLLCLTIDNGAGCVDMYCDSLISADSLNREGGIMQLVVYDVPTFYSTATGVSEMYTADITVAPNPFSETTVFTVNSNEVYSFELTDVLGKKVKEMNSITGKQFEMSRSGMQNGIYFYKIYSSEAVIGVGKVVIR